MATNILQINFKFNMSSQAYKQAVAPLVEQIADVSGLRWKIWMINEDKCEAGGLHLFDNEPALQAYLASPSLAQITSNPALSDFSVKQFAIMADHSALTRAPVQPVLSG